MRLLGWKTLAVMTALSISTATNGALRSQTQAEYDEMTSKSLRAILQPLGISSIEAAAAHNIGLSFFLIGPCSLRHATNAIANDARSYFSLSGRDEFERAAFAIVGRLLIGGDLGRPPHTAACAFAERAIRERFLLR
jgi:hypothetical protein